MTLVRLFDYIEHMANRFSGESSDAAFELDLQLAKRFEQEPRRAVRSPRNPTEYNEQARERLALKFALVGTDEEARAARGLPPSPTRPTVVAIEPAWRPADGGAS